MAVSPAVVTLFSAKVLKNLDPSHVWTEGCNTNYEGEIKGKGDVLKIFSVPRPTPANYVVGTNMTYERLRPSAITLTIDQDKAWAIQEDDLERQLSRVKSFDELAINGAWALADLAEVFLSELMASQAAITYTSQIVGNGAGNKSAYDLIVEIVTAIKETAKVAPMGMHAFIPFWFYAKLLLDQRFTGSNTAAARLTLRGERIGVLENVTIHETSNALDSAGTGQDTDGPVNTIIVCSDKATTWGRHIPEEGMVQYLDNKTNHDGYDNRMRARYVFGGTVVYPQLIAKCVVTKGN
ncbi:MAG: hypothetical protein A3E01_15365 [Gammaproteobacteria bacterium RIFCSPHIGHO2_12_FULL_63_22]|nr:MAG: hypothetical protein A3E01_15365 [Gammaproteobacteria bacterium RIFCSPHIGHO2_12_FULL_63_22]